MTRFIKRGALRNAPLVLLGAGMLAAFEVFASGYVLRVATGPLAYAECVMLFGCSGLSFWLMLSGSAFAADPRPKQRERALPARLAALAALAMPVTFLANGVAYDRQIAEWKAYAGSPAEAADKAIIADPMSDSRDRTMASLRLQRAGKPASAEPGFGDMMMALMLHGVVLLSAATGRRERPETEAEARRRFAAERAAKAAKTRRRNQGKPAIGKPRLVASN